ncbi:MAG: D-TA family PLP-dependent enzyme [Bacteroidota bacterium]
MDKAWYSVTNAYEVFSPALLVYPQRVLANIERMIAIAGDVDRLRPHVKTHKMAELAHMHLEKGIKKFKCSTLAEAQMLAESGAEDILLAYQPVGPNIHAFCKLAKKYSQIKFAALVDTVNILRALSTAARSHQVEIGIFLDLNSGMNRTGISIGSDAKALYQFISALPQVYQAGLHAYDGHFRDPDFEKRKTGSDEAFQTVWDFEKALLEEGQEVPEIIAGGSPTFPVHAQRARVVLSPGTYVFWDAGYGEMMQELPFEPAAMILSRVISKPADHLICVDLGHKSIAAENPIDKRVRFLNLEVEAYVGHSEEHLILQPKHPENVQVGDILYGIPWHICPTVALHQEAYVVEGEKTSERWKVVARNRLYVIN